MTSPCRPCTLRILSQHCRRLLCLETGCIKTVPRASSIYDRVTWIIEPIANSQLQRTVLDVERFTHEALETNEGSLGMASIKSAWPASNQHTSSISNTRLASNRHAVSISSTRPALNRHAASISSTRPASNQHSTGTKPACCFPTCLCVRMACAQLIRDHPTHPFAS